MLKEGALSDKVKGKNHSDYNENLHPFPFTFVVECKRYFPPHLHPPNQISPKSFYFYCYLLPYICRLLCLRHCSLLAEFAFQPSHIESCNLCQIEESKSTTRVEDDICTHETQISPSIIEVHVHRLQILIAHRIPAIRTICACIWVKKFPRHLDEGSCELLTGLARRGIEDVEFCLGTDDFSTGNDV